MAHVEAAIVWIHPHQLARFARFTAMYPQFHLLFQIVTVLKSS